jgi:hypothetical protein
VFVVLTKEAEVIDIQIISLTVEMLYISHIIFNKGVYMKFCCLDWNPAEFEDSDGTLYCSTCAEEMINSEAIDPDELKRIALIA